MRCDVMRCDVMCDVMRRDVMRCDAMWYARIRSESIRLNPIVFEIEVEWIGMIWAGLGGLDKMGWGGGKREVTQSGCLGDGRRSGAGSAISEGSEIEFGNDIEEGSEAAGREEVGIAIFSSLSGCSFCFRLVIPFSESSILPPSPPYADDRVTIFASGGRALRVVVTGLGSSS